MAKLSGGTNLLDCGAGLAGEVTTASAYCWRRANQGASQLCILSCNTANDHIRAPTINIRASLFPIFLISRYHEIFFIKSIIFYDYNIVDVYTVSYNMVIKIKSDLRKIWKNRPLPQPMSFCPSFGSSCGIRNWLLKSTYSFTPSLDALFRLRKNGAANSGKDEPA